jgi:hypothetical protein
MNRNVNKQDVSEQWDLALVASEMEDHGNGYATFCCDEHWRGAVLAATELKRIAEESVEQLLLRGPLPVVPELQRIKITSDELWFDVQAEGAGFGVRAQVPYEEIENLVHLLSINQPPEGFKCLPQLIEMNGVKEHLENLAAFIKVTLDSYLAYYFALAV